jgi:hypothetical protein
MSFQKLTNSLENAKKKPFYTIKGQISESVLLNAEKLLGFRLSKQHREFFSKVGYLSFLGHEFYGICDERLNGNTVLCAVETTLRERKKINLPEKWIIFCYFDDGYFGYLDYSDVNTTGEPPLIMTIYDGKSHNIVKKVSVDMGDYIYKCVENS